MPKLSCSTLFARVVVRVVDAEDQRDVFVGGRGGDDRFFRAGVEMATHVRSIGKHAGRLDDNIDAELPPGQAARLF